MNNEDKKIQPETVSIEDAKTAEPAPESEIDTLRAQLSEMNDKYLRLAAELENTRRRSAIDAESRARNRAMAVAEKILPVMDAIESAFAQIGITKIESIGTVLNPMFHNAIQMVDCPSNTDPKPAPNTIVDEMQSGYMFGDTVLRTAMVIVCK